jgi:hypothetical protein
MTVGTPGKLAGPISLPGLLLSFKPAMYFLRDAFEQKRQHVVEVVDEDEESPEKHPILVCRACGHTITSEDQRINVAGAHLHTFFNPAGIVFELGCFSTAPGCCVLGEASAEFSWFAGYLWSVVLCGRCGTHLGWQFQSAERTFYGLIYKKIRSEEQEI